ncbi:MAG: ABC transporter ATP-binding protein [Candidatus Thermoplasmatota archaeon]|nr:ABC transporter ATP-binding protein [Candidatus Thermoplasmatota archaeon]
MAERIVLKDVKKTFKMGEVDIKALDGVDLVIDRGKFVVVLGPSGSGKTTLLNVIGGIDTPDSGSVIIDGEDIAAYPESRLSAYRRDSVGWIFQFFNLIPSLTALENVALSLDMAGDRKDMMERAREYLEHVGLKDRVDSFPSQLSGGEQQRVAIARALVKRPRIVLADEPTGNLDQETGMTIASLMRDICSREKKTFIVVSHDPKISSLADVVIRIRDGKTYEG